MNLRILHLYEPTPDSPFLSAQAAANHWLPAALRARDHEVVARPLALTPPETLRELASHFDVVHAFGSGDLQEAAGAPVLQTLYRDGAASATQVALSWRQARAARIPPAAVVPTAIPTEQVETPPAHGDHLATVYRDGDERALRDALAVAHSAERELVVLHSVGQAPPASSPLMRLVAVRPEDPPAELLTAAACLSFGDAPADAAAVTALAAGVPVLTLEGLAAAETIVSGESGFVCASLDEAKRAVERLELLNPRMARLRARTLFDVDSAAAQLERVYASVARGERPSFRHPEQVLAVR